MRGNEQRPALASEPSPNNGRIPQMRTNLIAAVEYAILAATLCLVLVLLATGGTI